MSALAWYNNWGGHRINFLLAQVDVLSKFAHVIPLANKEMETVAAGIRQVLEQSGTAPKFISTDQGTEFTGHVTQALFKEFKIKAYTMRNPRR